jgi:hypothetical protein
VDLMCSHVLQPRLAPTSPGGRSPKTEFQAGGDDSDLIYLTINGKPVDRLQERGITLADQRPCNPMDSDLIRA